MGARAPSVVTPLPWWATAGSESCPVCLQRYHLEMEVRCTDCDAPLCPHCAVTVALQVAGSHCPDCHHGEQEEA